MAANRINLPLIDFTKLEEEGLVPGTPEWIKVRDQVKLALQEIGSFEAIFGDIVPVEVRDAAVGVLHDVFDLPLGSMAHADSLLGKIYYRNGEGSQSMRLDNNFGTNNIQTDEGVERICKCLWPQGEPPRLRVNMQTYAEKISQVEQLLRKIVLESFGCEKYLEENLDMSQYFFGWIKYEATGKADGEQQLKSHRDKTFLSILYQNGVNGLEIETNNGEWRLVHQQKPNSFFVLVGDSFHAWSNGRLHPPLHRVTLDGSITRYVIALFAMPKPGCVVSAPDEVIDEEHPRLQAIKAEDAFYKYYNNPNSA